MFLNVALVEELGQHEVGGAQLNVPRFGDGRYIARCHENASQHVAL